MNDPLSTYLHDHLAGSHVAIQLLDSLHDQFKDDELGTFALALCAEVKRDQETLEEIIASVGKTHFDLAAAAGWLGQKASELKLRRDHPGVGLGSFEALETLALGIRGKLALWEALPLIREIDGRIPALDFDRLKAIANDQFARVDARRLQLIQTTFGVPTPV